MDDDAIGRSPQPAQTPHVRLQVALAQPLSPEDVVQRDDERPTVGATEAHQARQRASALAPPASVPLQDHDLGITELGGYRCEQVRALVDPPGLDLLDGESRVGASFVGDELSVSAHAALGPA